MLRRSFLKLFAGSGMATVLGATAGASETPALGDGAGYSRLALVDLDSGFVSWHDRVAAGPVFHRIGTDDDGKPRWGLLPDDEASA